MVRLRVAVDGPYFDVLANHLPVIDHTEIQVVQAGLFSSPNDTRTSLAHWAFFAAFVILINLSVDLLYGVLNPRIRGRR